MPSLDHATLATLAAALVGAFVTIWAAIHQARKSWLLSSATLVISFVDKFNASDWGEERRVKFIQLLLKPNDDKDRTLIGNYGYGVLGFYEHLGYLVRCGALDLMMVHNKFGWEIVCYYQLVCEGMDLMSKDLLADRNYNRPFLRMARAPGIGSSAVGRNERAVGGH